LWAAGLRHAARGRPRRSLDPGEGAAATPICHHASPSPFMSVCPRTSPGGQLRRVCHARACYSHDAPVLTAEKAAPRRCSQTHSPWKVLRQTRRYDSAGFGGRPGPWMAGCVARPAAARAAASSTPVYILGGTGERGARWCNTASRGNRAVASDPRCNALVPRGAGNAPRMSR
jgi:hypothetical protein